MLEAYFLTLTGVALAQASPGPNFLAVVSVGLGQGRRGALFTVLGVTTGMVIWACAVAFGLATLLAFYPKLLTLMKLIGGSYLLWMGLKALKSSTKAGRHQAQAAQGKLSDVQAWRHGLLVVITNPKAALMWVAVGTFLFGSGLSPLEVAGFGPVAAVSAFLIYGGYGYLFTTEIAMWTYRRISRWIELCMGLAFAGLGGNLIWNGIQELRK